jgi:hypothetical protein
MGRASTLTHSINDNNDVLHGDDSHDDEPHNVGDISRDADDNQHDANDKLPVESDAQHGADDVQRAERQRVVLHDD